MEKLRQAALAVLDKAYSPYSGIRVAAAAEAADGTVFTGVNIENASYGLTVCAERNAVFRAIGEGQRDLLRMAVVTDSPLVQSPCGACRQVLFERLDKAAAHVATVKPDVALEQGKLPNTLGNKPCRRWQNKARPVFALKPGAGKKGILRAAAYIHTQHRTRAAQKLLNNLVHTHLS